MKTETQERMAINGHHKQKHKNLESNKGWPLMATHVEERKCTLICSCLVTLAHCISAPTSQPGFRSSVCFLHGACSYFVCMLLLPHLEK